MQTTQSDGVWDFVLDQILGMQWLNELTAAALTAAGMDTTTAMGASVQFFIYDTIKITILLCTLIFIISWIQSYFPPEKSRSILGRFNGLGANIIAALLGTVTPFCSCSSIPLFIGFTGAGLPLGVTFSFLISSPMVDLGSLVLLTDIFGLQTALLYVVLGLVIAVVGGTVIDAMKMDRYIEPYIRQMRTAGIDSPELSLRERISFASGQVKDTLVRVFPYILAGVALGAFIHNWIPQSWVQEVLGGNNPCAVVLAVLAGAPMYADIFGAIPVAEALYAHGAQPGAILAFMMSVTTLSLPSLILLRKAVQLPLLGLFIFICVVGMITVGYAFNFLHPLVI